MQNEDRIDRPRCESGSSSLALAADAVPANRFENLWRHRVEAAHADRQEAAAWYDERIAAIAAEITAKPATERTEEDQQFLKQKGEQEARLKQLRLWLDQDAADQMARRELEAYAAAVDAREVDYARCRVSAYEVRASDLTDYIVACMRVAGYRLEGNPAAGEAAFHVKQVAK